MCERVVALVLGACCLAACASPRATGQGDVNAVIGAVIAPHGDAAEGGDAAYARAVQDEILSRVGGSLRAGKPRYLVQVGVARSLPGVGVSSAAGALTPDAWRSPGYTPPWWRAWAEGERSRIVTMAVIDARDGRTIAWSSLRVDDEKPASVARRLVEVVAAAPQR